MGAVLSDGALLPFFKKEDILTQEGAFSDFSFFVGKEPFWLLSPPYNPKIFFNINPNPATLLGEASSLWELLPKSSVKAVTPCICVCISLNRYRSVLQQDVRFLQNICQLLSSRLNSGINLANSLTEPVETRLAKFILLHEEKGVFTHQLTTCAAVLNVSYRHLLRTITNFRENRILEKQKSKYVIRDRSALEVLAENLSHS